MLFIPAVGKKYRLFIQFLASQRQKPNEEINYPARRRRRKTFVSERPEGDNAMWEQELVIEPGYEGATDEWNDLVETINQALEEWWESSATASEHADDLLVSA